jgi:hypothetical protein
MRMQLNGYWLAGQPFFGAFSLLEIANQIADR